MSKKAVGRRPLRGLAGIRRRRRRIVHLHDPDAAVLRLRSRPVRGVDVSIRRLIADMLVTMRGADGVGLAAPQIGVPLRVLVADIGTGPVAVVNPRLRLRRGSQLGIEGCLSIPGIYGEVRRAQRVEVEGRSPLGRRIVLRGSDLLARVLQHEIDHLNGVLFIDRVEGGRLIRRSRRPVRRTG